MSLNEKSFRPFETSLDEGEALNVLKDAASRADDGEIFLERRRSESLSFDDGRLRNAAYDSAEGFGLRVVRGETAGYAHSSETSIQALKRAAETAKLAAREGGGALDAGPARTNQRLYAPVDPLAGPAFAAKVETLREIDDYLRARDKRVAQVSANISGGLQEVEILRPDGERYADIRPMVRMDVSVIVEKDGRRESGHAGGGGRTAATGWRATSTARAPPPSPG